MDIVAIPIRRICGRRHKRIYSDREVYPDRNEWTYPDRERDRDSDD